MVKSLTLNQAKKLIHNQTLYHLKNKNADGTAQRWRVSGKPKIWKTMPERVQVPVKYGLYGHDCITENDLHLVSLTEPKRVKKRAKI
jgi:hypothetical protein